MMMPEKRPIPAVFAIPDEIGKPPMSTGKIIAGRIDGSIGSIVERLTAAGLINERMVGDSE